MKKLMLLLAFAICASSLFAYQFTDDKGYTWTLETHDSDDPVAGSGEYIDSWWIDGVSPSPTGDFEIPAKLGGKTVYGIGMYSFQNVNGLTNLTIASGIRVINDAAFKDAADLTKVTVLGELDWVAPDAFDGTRFLADAEAEHQALVLGGHFCKYFGTNETYTVSAGVKVIDDGAFSTTPTNGEGKISLKSITFNDGLKTIGAYAFSTENGYFDLDEIAIPDSVTEIGMGAFRDCVAKSLKIGNGVKDLEWMSNSFRINLSEFEPKDIEEPVCPNGTNDFALAVTLTSASGKSAGRYVGDQANTWWHWTAPYDGIAAFSTFGSTCDTMMSVYMGASEDDLTEIAFDDDFYDDFTSKVTFPVKQGETYHIAVNGYRDDPDDLVLHWASEEFPFVRSITFGDGITEIPSYRFNKDAWALLESVTFGAGLEVIDEGAFCNRMSLSSADFSRATKLRVIDREAFGWCGLKSLDFSACTELKRIMAYAFTACTSLESVTFNEGLVDIDEYAFSYCAKLKGVAFPSTLSIIEDHAFCACWELSEIKLNDGLLAIGSGAFGDGWGDGCNAVLETVDIPSSVAELGEKVFEGCTNLTEITGCEGVNRIEYLDPFGDDVPAKMQWYCGEFDEEGEPLPFKVVTLGKVVLGFQGSCPSELKAEDFGTAEVIGEYAFACREIWTIPGYGVLTNFYNASVSNLTSVTIPESVRAIGGAAFAGACNLTELKFAGDSSALYFTDGSFRQTGLKELKGRFWGIAGEAFAGCPDLKDVDIELVANPVMEGGPYLGVSAFEDCMNLANAVVCMNGILTNEHGEVQMANPEFEGRAFNNCMSLTNVELVADGAYLYIEYEEDSPFGGCENLVSAKIDLGEYGGVSEGQGCNLFPHRDKLRTVSFNAYSISYGTFYEACNLESCLIGDDVEVIDECAFYGCTNLTDIVIPEGVVSIRENAFEDCSGLTNLVGCAGVLLVGSHVFEGTALFGDQTNGAFVVNGILASYVDVPGETRAVIPEGVRVISAYSFYECEVSEIEFPSTAGYIPWYTAVGCQNLKTVVCKNPDTLFCANPEWDSGALFDVWVEVFVKKAGQRAYAFEEIDDEVYGDCYAAVFEELRFHNDETEDGPFVGGTSYVGWLMEKGSGQVVGSITVKTGKANKNGQSKVTAKIQMAGWKKSYTAQFEVDEETGKAFIADPGLIVNGYGVNPLNGMWLGGNWLSGRIAFDGKDYDIRGGNAKKDVDSFDAFANHVWAAAFCTQIDSDELDLATANGMSTMTFTVGKKGKIKVAGVMADGTKVSSTAQMVAGDNGVFAAPVSVGLYAGKKGGFSCLLKFFTDANGAPVMTLEADDDSSAKGVDGTLSTWTLPYVCANQKVWTSIPLYVQSVGEVDTAAGLTGDRYFSIYIRENTWCLDGVYCLNEMLRRACKGFSPYYSGVGGTIDPKNGKLKVAKADKWSVLTEKKKATYAADIAESLSTDWGVYRFGWYPASDGKYLMPYEGSYEGDRYVPTDWFLIDEGVKIDKTTGEAIYPDFCNECNAKVTYNKKTGAFSGSSQYYWVDETKPAKHVLKKGKFTWSGVVIDGRFYGAATAKGIESFWIGGRTSLTLSPL